MAVNEDVKQKPDMQDTLLTADAERAASAQKDGERVWMEVIAPAICSRAPQKGLQH